MTITSIRFIACRTWLPYMNCIFLMADAYIFEVLLRCRGCFVLGTWMVHTTRVFIVNTVVDS